MSEGHHHFPGLRLVYSLVVRRNSLRSQNTRGGLILRCAGRTTTFPNQQSDIHAHCDVKVKRSSNLWHLHFNNCEE